jgi:glycerophosphoryl diester phosphodiesterase
LSEARPWPYARILAHRGGGKLAPENTLGAIRHGHERGFRAIEFDAMLARDGVPVLIHDDRLERTTNGRGPVAAQSASELGRLDAGSWFSPAYAGEPVPLLSEAIALCRRLGTWINIEIKPSPGAEAPTGEVVARTAASLYADVLRSGGDRADAIEPAVPLLSSFARESLAAARRVAPDLPRGLLVDRLPRDWREALQALGCVSLHTSHRHLTREQARAVKDSGYWLFCYTVDDPARVREIFDWGVDALCTDRIDRIGPLFA